MEIKKRYFTNDQCFEENAKMIIADYRERKIIGELKRKSIEVDVKSLISADFIIQIKDLSGNIKEVGIERKTTLDFLTSIIDKRILNQLISLKEQFAVPLLIIEGSENIYTIRNFHPNAIRGMLSAIAIDFQIPILYTRSFRDTSSLLNVIAKRLDTPRRHISLLKKKKPVTLKEQQEYIIESLPGVGPNLSKSLLKNFKSVKDVFGAGLEDLKRVDKIGKKKAEGIRKVIEGNY